MCAVDILEQWQCVRCVYLLAGKNSAVIDCVGMSDSPCWSQEADFFFPVTGEEHYLPCSEGCCWHTESSRIQTSEIVGAADSTTCEVSLLLTVNTGTAHDCLCRGRGFHWELVCSVLHTLFSHCFLRCLNTEGLMEGRAVTCRVPDSNERCHVPFLWPFANWKNMETSWCSCILWLEMV